jgi:integrase
VFARADHPLQHSGGGEDQFFHFRADLDPIFTAPDGEMLKPDSVSASISLLCRKLKLPKGARLHTLRHSHGSQLIADGVPIPEVSARLGLANPTVTMAIYAHQIPGQGDAAERWEQIQQAVPKEKTQLKNLNPSRPTSAPKTPIKLVALTGIEPVFKP